MMIRASGNSPRIAIIASIPFIPGICKSIRYYDFNLWSEMKFVEKLRSIHRNPEQRGLVTRPEDWRWSSFRHDATEETGVVEIESQSTARGRKQLGIFPTVRMPSAEENPRPSGSLDGAPSRIKLKTIVRATRRTDFSIRIETYV